METNASWVRVYWQEDVPGGRPPQRVDARRLVVAGSGVPTTGASLVRVPVGGRPSGDDGFADEHLVAEADPGNPWSTVADVLIVRGPPEWAATLLAGFPGRLVTAFDGRGRESLLDVVGQGLARLRPLAADRTGPDLWPYASFVHAWTVAGRPLSALHDVCLTEAASRHGVRVSVVGRSRAWPAAS